MNEAANTQPIPLPVNTHRKRPLRSAYEKDPEIQLIPEDRFAQACRPTAAQTLCRARCLKNNFRFSGYLMKKA